MGPKKNQDNIVDLSCVYVFGVPLIKTNTIWVNHTEQNSLNRNYLKF